MKIYSFVIRSHSAPKGNAPFSISFPLDSDHQKSYLTEASLRADLLFCGFPEKGITDVLERLKDRGEIENHEPLSPIAFTRLTTPDSIA